MKIKDLKARARKLLLGKYGILIASQFTVSMVSYSCIFGLLMFLAAAMAFTVSGNTLMMTVSALIFVILLLAVMVVLFFMSLGTMKQYLNLCRSGRAVYTDIFYAFTRGSHPWKYLWVALLLFLLLLVPGLLLTTVILTLAILAFGNSSFMLVLAYVVLYLYIIYMSLRYAFAPLIVVDKPGTGVIAAFRRSARLTKKRKLRLLWLYLFSFLPWYIPLVISFGLAGLWIVPYIYTTVYLFYLRAEEEVFPEESYGEASTEPIDQSRVREVAEAEVQEQPSETAEAMSQELPAETAEAMNQDQTAEETEALDQDRKATEEDT